MLTSRSFLVVTASLSIALGCGSDSSGGSSTPDGGNRDASSSTGGAKSSTGGKAAGGSKGSIDAGPDAPSTNPDSGNDAGDPCVADLQNPASTVGCNGPVIGAKDHDAAFGECLSTCPHGYSCAKAGSAIGFAMRRWPGRATSSRGRWTDRW